MQIFGGTTTSADAAASCSHGRSGRALAFSRHVFARAMLLFTPSRKKGRREDRAPAGTHKTPVLNRCTRNAQGRHRAAETRPSLRDGLTAYAALSREPSSFWPPSPLRYSRQRAG